MRWDMETSSVFLKWMTMSLPFSDKQLVRGLRSVILTEEVQPTARSFPCGAERVLSGCLWTQDLQVQMCFMSRLIKNESENILKCCFLLENIWTWYLNCGSSSTRTCSYLEWLSSCHSRSQVSPGMAWWFENVANMEDTQLAIGNFWR